MSDQRTIVVTGAASGIGLATTERLRSLGHRVIGIDLHDAEIIADLATDEGRSRVADEVTALVGDSLDALIVAAGVEAPDARSVAVNYFGAVVTMELLRPHLAKSRSPRVVVLSSVAIMLEHGQPLVDACLAGEEDEAAALADANPDWAYVASKTALSAWVRRTAVKSDWAGKGILLNAVAPGLVLTPMGQRVLESRDVASWFGDHLALDRHARPDELACILEFLAGPANSFMVGQLIFVDGGVNANLLNGSDAAENSERSLPVLNNS